MDHQIQTLLREFKSGDLSANNKLNVLLTRLYPNYFISCEIQQKNEYPYCKSHEIGYGFLDKEKNYHPFCPLFTPNEILPCYIEGNQAGEFCNTHMCYYEFTDDPNIDLSQDFTHYDHCDHCYDCEPICSRRVRVDKQLNKILWILYGE